MSEEVGEMPLANDVASMVRRYLPQFPDLETDEEMVFTWEITDWHSLPERALSPVFEAGGFRWRLLLFPEGNGSSCRGRISLYLQIQDQNESPETPLPKSDEPGSDDKQLPAASRWHVCCQFALAVWNPQHPDAYICQMAHHRYNPRTMDWGYSHMCEVRSALTRGTRPAALIEKNKVNITAFLRTIKDPTGILWHDFVDYDSRLETGYTGLTNQGATCYLNSLLQSLYFTRVFRRAVYEIPAGDSESVTSGLQRLFYLLATSPTPVNTNSLTRSFGWDTADAFTQHDVQELNRVLMDRLESKMNGTSVEGVLTKIFVGQMKSFIKCINVDFESARVEDFWDIQLNVKNMKDIYASFRDYVQTEVLEGENQYHATGYGLQDANKGVIFESFPPVLHLQLKRYEYDFLRDVEVKINDRFEFPLDLDLQQFLDPESDAVKEAAAKGEPWEYALHGVLVHSGDLNAGHYYTLLKPEANGDWFRFDDDRVTRASLKEVLDDNFGGELPNSRGIKRITSAYMLVYIRKSRLEFVLPSSEDKWPSALPESIAAEKREEEQRRREIQEQRQYMAIRLLSRRQFAKHSGVGLATWTARHSSEVDASMPELLKVRRNLKIGQLYAAVAEHCGFDFIPSLWLVSPREYSVKRIHMLEPQHNEHTVEELSSWSDGPYPVLWVQESPGYLEDEVLVFVKEFNVSALKLTGVSTVWINKKQPLSAALAQFSNPGTRFYHERESMVEEMSPSALVGEQLVTGDIIVLETNLDKDALYPSACEFYDFLNHRVTLLLLPRPDVEESDGDEEPERVPSPEKVTPVVLITSSKEPYSQLAERAADALGGDIDPTHLQLWPAPYEWEPLREPLRNDGSNMDDLMLVDSPLYVYYRVLDRPLAEFEQMIEVPTTWVQDYRSEPQTLQVLVSTNATVSELIRELASQLSLPAEDVPRVKMWTARHNRTVRTWTPAMQVKEVLMHEGNYASLMSQEELNLRSAAAGIAPLEQRLVTVFHFQKDDFRTHSIPFTFVLHENEPFSVTRKRIQQELGLGDKSFEKIRIAVCGSPSRVRYLEDDNEQLFESMGDDDAIGLDHADKRRVVHQQQAIVIK
ncbi:Ubiquitin carboxyl-terminal hydrolase 21 [Wickerhamiella sorbophila]|uniref:ubiquitinyl hydrolase 1 n=1 Tax=Wickerhamiella sorbophila TaxID=45607 RepID=A0A2T0FHW4_9ASCO|nr:Ubiquitin carboxyl-terminal hydrolase 21 [Wickerhamiella sorbophila]PRT54580.1 Ubiquitin carboxyl-terminal hydrolase 21 [Wickerhamiella sorbophila]